MWRESAVSAAKRPITDWVTHPKAAKVRNNATPEQRDAEQHPAATQQQATCKTRHTSSVPWATSWYNTRCSTNMAHVCVTTVFQRVPATPWEHFLEEILATAKQEVASANVWWPDETVTSVWWANALTHIRCCSRFINRQWHQKLKQPTNQLKVLNL